MYLSINMCHSVVNISYKKLSNQTKIKHPQVQLDFHTCSLYSVLPLLQKQLYNTGAMK